jgi:hypothetical protein
MTHRTESTHNLSVSYRLYMHQTEIIQILAICAELNALVKFVASLNESEYFTLSVSKF